jgi:diguanylate cyclase (GGDEF)-like protein
MKSTVRLVTVLVAFSLLFAGLAGYSRQSLLLKRLSNVLEDVLFKVRYSSEPLPASREKLLVVAVDDESSFRLGLRWPWPRTTFAEMIRRLTDKKAAVIGLNFTFTGLEDGKTETTQDMADAIRAHGHTVVGSALDRDRLLRPNKLLLEAGVKHGYLEKIVDDDFVIRRSYLSRADRRGGMGEPSFPLALRLEGGAQDAPRRSSRDEAINFTLKAADLKTVPAWKVLDGQLGQEALRGKTVLIGITSSLLSEEHRTPLGLMPGIAVHANEWVALEEGRRLQEFPRSAGFVVGWLMGAALLLLFLLRRIWLAALGFVLGFFLILLAAQFFFAADTRLPLFLLLSGPALALAVGSGANLLFLWLENRGLEKRVLHDKMTGLYTYDYLRVRLDDEWKRCQKLKLPVSVVMTDLDRFKRINDTLGHEVGNQMILRASEVIRQSARGYDVVSRYGGDEFVIMLWHANRTEAEAYRARLRDSYAKMAASLEEEMLKDSSVSIGIASYDPKSSEVQPQNPQELVERADKDLFEDKESRRRPGETRR